MDDRNSETHDASTGPVFVLLSFEGPDPYSRAGGLATRVDSLAQALAEDGFETHLFFVGAPEQPGHETRCGGRLHLHRWCQWISRYHCAGVYDGEFGKLNDWNASLAAWIGQTVLPAAVASGRRVVVLAEEWHTSWSAVQLAQRARAMGVSDMVRCFWNANNTFGFDRMPWSQMRETVRVTTVSRVMKHELWHYGVDSQVIPNGISNEWLQPCERGAVLRLRHATRGRLLLSKVARWDPHKRWLTTLEALAQLKASGVRPLLVARGGIEAHGREVLARADSLGLSTQAAACCNTGELGQALAHTGSDIVLVQTPLTRAQLQVLYRASDAVLANSGFEPFGLVGLESMACGGVSIVGSTGEDYATPGLDAISVQTDRPSELVSRVMALRASPRAVARIRRAARRTAARFTWPQVIRTYLSPLAS